MKYLKSNFSPSEKLHFQNFPDPPSRHKIFFSLCSDQNWTFKRKKNPGLNRVQQAYRKEIDIEGGGGRGNSAGGQGCCKPTSGSKAEPWWGPGG